MKNQIIKSILDTDLYKFSMSYAYMKLYPEAIGVFEFIDRSDSVYNAKFIERLNSEIDNLSQLSLSDEEFNWLSIVLTRYIPVHYWEWLRGFRFDPNKVKISLIDGYRLSIRVEDYLYKATLYEVVYLALVSELKNENLEWDYKISEDRLKEKIQYAESHNLRFSEFGTRRRFSYKMQDLICEQILRTSTTNTGTSNVHFAMKYNLIPIGTVAHEWIMFHAAMYGYKQANYLSLENWVNVYDGDLGIALTDTYTSDNFFSNFSRKHAKLFDGVRHDSGDPYKFIDDTVRKYLGFGIDPRTKTIVFSNSLDMNSFNRIQDYCKNSGINAVAGIGTNLTNDTTHTPANIVMKLTYAAMSERQKLVPCVKISDSSGKYTGLKEEVDLCLKVLNIKS